jgi:hypothetical protein
MFLNFMDFDEDEDELSGYGNKEKSQKTGERGLAGTGAQIYF